MSEPAEEITIDPPNKKRRIGFNIKHAILEVVERKKLSRNVDYKAIAARHATTIGNLRNVYHRFLKGEIEMGQPLTEAEKQLDQRVEHERLLSIIYRYKAMITTGFEGLVYKAEDKMSKGKPMAWKALGIPEVMRELKTIQAMQSEMEKGYVSILEEDIARKMREEKRLAGGFTGASNVLELVNSVSDEEKAHRALNDGSSELPEQA